MRADLILGLIAGIGLGWALKSSPICLTGLFRDFYFEKKRYYAVLILSIISIQGFIYHLMTYLGLIRGIRFLPPFSLTAIAVGGFLFGFGAGLADGCLTKMLVRCGDGRLAGWATLAGFLIAGYFFSAGAGNMFTYRFQKTAVVPDALIGRQTVLPVLVFAAASAVLITVMQSHRRAEAGENSDRPLRGGNSRDLSYEGMAVLLGVWLGICYLLSDLAGRHYGPACAMPVLSWAIAVLRPASVIGGCNIYDQKFGWGSMFVLGIIAGAFIRTLRTGGCRISVPQKKEALGMFAGGILMGIGAVWGQGCLMTNGYAATAQMSVKGWYAVPFLFIGIIAGGAVRRRNL